MWHVLTSALRAEILHSQSKACVLASVECTCDMRLFLTPWTSSLISCLLILTSTASHILRACRFQLSFNLLLLTACFTGCFNNRSTAWMPNFCFRNHHLPFSHSPLCAEENNFFQLNFFVSSTRGIFKANFRLDSHIYRLGQG